MTFLRIIRKPARPVVLGLLLVSCLTAGARVPQGGVEDTAGAVIRKLQAEYGPEDSARISRGVGQVASRWRPGDGDFEAFCTRHFIPSGRELDSAFAVIDRQMEVIRGHQREIAIALDLPVVTRSRPVTELDRLFSTTKPEVDYFQNGLALAIALNFPYYTLAEKERMGAFWSRREWAMVRAGDLFRTRPGEEKGPEPVTLPDELRDYTSLYILSMDHVLSPDMEVMFPEGTRLNCHNGLRDEIKGLYSRQDPLPRQRLISTILIHILNQTIPECMIGPTGYYWEPAANRVFLKKDGRYAETAFTTENDRRYRVLHHRMVSKMREDATCPEGSTYIERTFENRQLGEERVVEMLESVVGAPEKEAVAGIIRAKLGRPLEPFDIWYPGFQDQAGMNMDLLDEMIRDRYPSPQAFQEDIPQILMRIGFGDDQAAFLGDHVIVDPIPSGGHADGPEMKGAKAYLRTRFEPDGLNYKGYRVAMHEIGHTIEQNVSTCFTDYYFLRGIPCSPFTEAMADLIAYRDRVGLGVLPSYGPEEREASAIASFWFVCEIGAQALHEIRVWNWFYDHPDAGVEELKLATIRLAKEIWNEYFASVYGVRDVPLFAIYNHFIDGALYLHSYPLGNIVLMQLEEYFQGRDFASEMTRMCTIGRLTPDLWMIEATGKPFGTEPMLNAVRKAIANHHRQPVPVP